MTTVSCEPGVPDCEFDNSGVCSSYNGKFQDPSDMAWLIPLAAIFMCTNAFGVGANDVANAWGTSVASGAISLRKACLIAGFANILGAVTLGYGVSDAIQRGVADVEEPDCWGCGYCNSRMSLYAVGMFGALVGSSAFLLVATFGSAPVSGTHAVIGGVVGMTIAGTSGNCLVWNLSGLGGIILSWVLSPIVAGIIGASLYIATEKYIIEAPNPKERALTFMPFFIALSSFILMFLILLKSKATAKVFPIWGHFLLSLVAGAIAYCAGFILRDRYVRGRLPSDMQKANNRGGGTGGNYANRHSNHSEAAGDEPSHSIEMDSKIELAESEDFAEIGGSGRQEGGHGRDEEQDPSSTVELAGGGQGMSRGGKTTDEAKDNKSREGALDSTVEGEHDMKLMQDPEKKDAITVFKYLIVFNAALESFAHGSNDTGNATAPFSAVFNTVNEGIHSCKSPETPEWALFVAGCCVAIGVNTFGYRVMTTVGKRITIVNFHRGFCMEFASTAAVVIATLLRMPVSTTHCQIGAVVAVGLAAFGWKQVHFGVVGQIVLSWIITLPFAGLFAAMMVAIIKPGITN